MRRWWWVPALVVVQKLAFLALLVRFSPGRWYERMFNWDGFFYLHIARDGYQPGQLVDGRAVRNDLAFFPLYPMVGRAVSWLPGLGLRPALLVVAWASCLAAVWGIFRLGEEIHSPRFGALWALAWTVVPRGFLQVMPYSESLFTAFSVWTLVALARGRWWTAAVLCALAGATRSTGLATVGAVAGALVFAMVRRWRSRARYRELGTVPWSRHELPIPGWSTMVGALLVSSLGTAAALAHVIWRSGSWDAYLAVQGEWGMRLGSPLSTLGQWWEAWRRPYQWRHVSLKLVAWALPVWTVLMAAALWGARRRPRWWPAVAHASVLFALMACAQSYFNSKERYLLPAVGCLLPLVLLVVRLFDARRGRARSLAIALLVLAWVLGAVSSAVIGALVVARSGISP